MCVISLSTPDSTERISTERFVEMSKTNPDGMGIAWVEDGEIKVWRSMFNLDSLILRYDHAWEIGSPILCHFRITTHGATDLGNCHPFFVPNHSVVMAHNGTINNMLDKRTKTGPSDTKLFIRQILAHLPRRFWLHETILHLIEERVNSSRLVFLDASGNYRIVNEKNIGWWDKNGHWYSNRSFLPNTKVVKTTRFECLCTSDYVCLSCRTRCMCDNEAWTCEFCKDNDKKSSTIEAPADATIVDTINPMAEWETALDSGCFYICWPVCWWCLPSDEKGFKAEDIAPIIPEHLSMEQQEILECTACGWNLHHGIPPHPPVERG